MTSAETPTPTAERPPRRKLRVMRMLAWSLGGLLALVLALAAGAWWWLGSNQSLGFALAQAARHLPAGQTLESREVSGSLRAGGRIGWLRWQSESLAVEVQEARIGWQLAPLFRRQVRLGEVHAASVTIERRGPVDDQPVTPIEPIVLPVEVDLPFRVDALRWTGPPAFEATALAGHYRYADAQHSLEISGVDIAGGHYDARATLQGPAPMALDATVHGRLRAPLGQERAIDVLAEATAKGTLAGTEARLAVTAQLKPAEPDAQAPMEAQLRANLAPWLPQPVIDAHAELRNVDLARLWPEAPQTLLDGEVDAGPDAAAGSAAWQARADIRNAKPGPWDQGKLPLEQVQGQVRYDGTGWQVPEALLRAGGGRIEAEGRWQPAPAPWEARATVRGVRPGALHTRLAGAPVSGRVTAEQRGEALLFDVALQAEGGAGDATLPGLRLDRAQARGQWQAQQLDLKTLRIEAAGASVEGKLLVHVGEQTGSGNLNLRLPGGEARLQGKLAPTRGDGTIEARVEDAAVLQRWTENLPGLATVFGGASAQGSASLDATFQGGWQAMQRRIENPGEAPRGAAEPKLRATLTVPKLDLRLPTAPATATAPVDVRGAAPIQLRGLRAELDGSVAQASLNIKGEAASGTRKLTLDARGGGGMERAGQWRLMLANLRAQIQDSTRPGPWTLELARELNATLRIAGERLDVEGSGGAATLRGPVPGTVRVEWEPTHFNQSGLAPNRVVRLRSKGRMEGLPMAWAETLGASAALAEVGLTGDLLFDGDWDIDAGDALRGRVRLMRKSGDLRVQAGESALVTRIVSRGSGAASERTMNTDAQAITTPAGLRQAEVTLDAEGENVRATLAWDSERAGQIQAEASTRLQRRGDGWQWAADAPLAGRIKARLPNLGVWSILAPPGWRIAGTLEADATLAGDRSVPRWTGTLGADQLALRAPVEGLDLRDGRLRATLSGDRVEITEFTLQGGTGSQTRIPGKSGNRSTSASEAAADGGTLSARGELAWGAASAAGSGIRMNLQAQLRKLRALVRTDRQLTLSGDLQARLEAGQFNLRGKLRTDRAVIILPDESAPSLGGDVVVRSAAREREAAEAAQRALARSEAVAPQASTAKPPDISIAFDLGDDFAVQGRGITTRLEGKLDIVSTSLAAPPRITGEVRTVEGQYRAYGQRLNVETGIARFNGPYDNPALDILALRPLISQRAGVQITGTAQSPRVRLYSEPPLSDAETLSWVVLGRASATSGGESLLMQQAALALLGGLGKGGSGASLASRFGLDELGFQGPSDGGEVKQSGVTVGKRLTKDFYVTYQASLAGTVGTLYLFYDLTRRLTLRAQAGLQSGIDLIYTLQYD